VGVLKACQPRKDLLEGSINLEIFTASLNQVASYYRDQTSSGHAIYTDAEIFFREGTYFTPNMEIVLRDVFSRLSGDMTAPVLKRLETGFGGGKTHTLIACLHLAKKGQELAPYVSGFLPVESLPEPESVEVVAIPGDAVAVKKTWGTELKPYPLWAEIARQIGGENLCKEVSQYLERLDSPDEAFFKKIFQGRKVLILIDELAHYAARWAVAFPKAKTMLSTFFMSLLEYASRNPGIAVVVTLAGIKDAFSAQTAELSKTLSDLTGESVNTDEAVAIQQEAAGELSTILARRETVVVPVQAKDLSAVLGKRLFENIDKQQAKREVAQYRQVYERNLALLPGNLQLEPYCDEMTKVYPFHPSLLDLLNNKLSTVPTFQKTRGVLRILALAVRSIWEKKLDVPMIHACHLDFHNSRTVDELLGRTDNASMAHIITADLGSADTTALSGGRSNAEFADRENPHPEGIPYHVYTWKTVFLHSLAGQEEGLASHVFGINEADALLAVTQPSLTPSQVKQALEDIKTKAFYLREKDGLYYAVPQPNVNLALSRIRGSLTEEQIINEIETKARKLFGQNRSGFIVKTDVVDPQDLPDNQERSVLGVLSIRLEEVRPDQFITTVGRQMPRMYQNSLFLLIPETTQIHYPKEEQRLIPEGDDQRARARQTLYALARDVLASRKLKENPQNYGISPNQLEEAGMDIPKREKDLETRVSLTYRYLAYPVSPGVFAVKDIRTAGGEGGVAQFEQIRKILKETGEMITADPITKETLISLKQLFFKDGSDYIGIKDIKEKFHMNRSWPVLEEPGLLEIIVREGVAREYWCLACDIDESTGIPKVLYGPGNSEIPLHFELDPSFGLVTVEGARQRHWGAIKGPDIQEVQNRVNNTLEKSHVLRVAQVREQVRVDRDDIVEEDIDEVLVDLIRKEKALAFEGDPQQKEKPATLVTGSVAVRMRPTDDLVVITRGEAARRGWLKEKPSTLKLEGERARKIFFSGLFRKLGSLYMRGATSSIRKLDITEYDLPGSGRISIMLRGADAETMKQLGELFEILSGKLVPSSDSEIILDIPDPDEKCPLIQEIRRLEGKE